MIIAFIGSVFSPYYAHARSRGSADPLAHCAMNVVLYGEGGKRWAMSEYAGGRVHCASRSLTIGNSVLEWDGTTLVARIDERCAPWPAALRGTVRVNPQAVFDRPYALDGTGGGHFWQPIAPRARVEVRMDKPDRGWSGNAYVDANSGSSPLESAFLRWNWSRTGLRDGTLVHYDVADRTGTKRAIALQFGRSGQVCEAEHLTTVKLPRTGWGIAREARLDAAPGDSHLTTIEDTPFYARSLLRGQALGEEVTAMHESLSLERFRSRWVQALLPFRMRRLTA